MNPFIHTIFHPTPIFCLERCCFSPGIALAVRGKLQVLHVVQHGIGISGRATPAYTMGATR